jgi:hypothetical protein
VNVPTVQSMSSRIMKLSWMNENPHSYVYHSVSRGHFELDRVHADKA